MITFILLLVFFLIAIGFAIVAYTANQRKRAGQAEIPDPTAQRRAEHRASGGN
jgi:preprotein translocase subunit SecG